MGIMGEEAKKEATEFPYRVASPEFFFLLQRIDRLDEKLSARIDQVDVRIDRLDEKLSARIDQVEGKMSDRIDQVEGKLKPLIWATLGIVLASLALTVSV
ncbi:MAG TPA: hypothetical protein DHV84_03545, partial [Desulfotomaculum sp.]|nr:hypothetical protein [Desulfotomaculum sp.]